jgi:lauroyl/myristoyl acyltransferase
LKRVVIAALRLAAGRRPRAALLLAHALARLTAPLGFGIALEWLATVFPGLAADELRAARRRTWAGFLKGEALEAGLVRVGSGAYPPVVPGSSQAMALEPPLILVTFHVGPYQGIGAALRLLPAEVLAIARGQYATQADITLVSAGEDRWARAGTFHRALTALRSGTFLLFTVDAYTPGAFDVSSIDVPLLGGTLPLARGAFALARVSGAPIVPLVGRWRGTELEMVVGEPIPAALGEAEMAAATARWLEGYLRANPGEISVFVLERLRPGAGPPR